MTIQEYEIMLDAVIHAMPDNDAFIAVAFSREENRFQSFMSETMDADDALIVIHGLMKHFKLSPEAVAAS